MTTKAQIALLQVKEAPGGSLRINTVCHFLILKSVVELNRLLLKFLLLCHSVIQKGYCGDKAKSNFLGIIWEGKRSWKIHFSGFQRF